MGLLVAAGSFVLAAPAFAGFTSTQRLQGGFSFEEEGTTDQNTACVVASGPVFEVFGNATGVTGDCTVNIFYGAFNPNKASASVLKSDSEGTAKVSQQVETGLVVDISGDPLLCTTAPYSGSVVPEKCKSSGSVKATEGGANPDSVDQGKISVSCEVGSDAADLSPSPTTAQLETIQAAFSDRKDVKIDSKGKLTIKTKGSQDDGDGCD
jgi:hypothetical protein